MIDPTETARRFARDGVLHVAGFLSPVEVDELEGQLARYRREVVPTVPPGDAFCETAGDLATLKQLQRIDQHDRWFAEWAAGPQLAELAAALLQQPVRVQGVEWFNKPARIGRPTPPHQDGYYFCLTPDEAVTLWIALADVDLENGCLHYALGSHRQGIRPHGVSPILGFSQTVLDFDPAACAPDETLVARLSRGDLVVHHSATIHWAGANASDRPRPSAAVVYFSQRARRDDAAFARYQASSEAQQRELGALVR